MDTDISCRRLLIKCVKETLLRDSNVSYFNYFFRLQYKLKQVGLLFGE